MKSRQSQEKSAALIQYASVSKSILRYILFFALLILSTFSFSQQLVIRGQVVDAYGDTIDPRIQFGSNNVISIDGKFESQYQSSSYLHISHIGYFDIELQVNTDAELTNLGNISMIENMNWLDGPKNGTLKGHYTSGIIKYNREVRNWKLHGVSEFYNTDGKVTQRILFRKGMPISISVLRADTLSRIDFGFDKKRQVISILR